MSILQSINDLLKDIICPPMCVVCGKAAPNFVCKECLLKINFFGDSVCSRCGSPIFKEFDKLQSEGKICSLCKNEKYYFYKARSYGLYKNVMADIIKKYKYKKIYTLKKVLLYFLFMAFKNYYDKEKIDFIETVPDYVSNLKETWHFNHMQDLAKSLSQYLKIPFGNNILKIKENYKQQILDKDLRKLNVKDAYKIKDCLKIVGKNILLIDDVFTTGSTLNEISRILKYGGADKIFILTVARGA